MMSRRLQAMAALIVIQGTQHALAGEQFYEVNDTVRIGGGVGYTFINSDEIVYDGAGNRISHLFWGSQAPVVSGAIEAEFANGWTLRAGGAFAAAGNSHMEDYDWLDPYFVSYDFDDWTHRSVHPETRLAHYFSGDVAVGRDLPLGTAATLNLHAGLKYTDVKWNAYGGSFVYSITGYRADTFSVPDGTPGISFQQRYPGIFLGASLAAQHGPWSFSGQARGGVSIRATDTDHHWARDLRFEERYGATPFVTAAARVDYAFNDRAGVFLSGDFQQYFHAIGDSTMYDIPTGDQLEPTSTEGAGMTLRAISVSAGFRMKF